MTKEELKVCVCAEIDRQADRIIGISKRILEHPEIGFCDDYDRSQSRVLWRVIVEGDRPRLI